MKISSSSRILFIGSKKLVLNKLSGCEKFLQAAGYFSNFDEKDPVYKVYLAHHSIRHYTG